MHLFSDDRKTLLIRAAVSRRGRGLQLQTDAAGGGTGWDGLMSPVSICGCRKGRIWVAEKSAQKLLWRLPAPIKLL